MYVFSSQLQVIIKHIIKQQGISLAVATPKNRITPATA